MNLRAMDYAQRKLAAEIKRVVRNVHEGISIPDLCDVIDKERADIKDVIDAMLSSNILFLMDDRSLVIQNADKDCKGPIWRDPLLGTTDRLMCWLEESDQTGMSYEAVAKEVGKPVSSVRKILKDLSRTPEFSEQISNRITSIIQKLDTDDGADPQDALVETAITDLRERLIGLSTAAQSSQIDPRWQETLAGIEQLLGELGVPETHLARIDLRGVTEWLKSQNQ